MTLYIILGFLTFAVAVLDIYGNINKWNSLLRHDKTLQFVKTGFYAAIFVISIVLFNKDQDEKLRVSRVGRFQLSTNGRWVNTPTLRFNRINSIGTKKDFITFQTKANDLFSLRTVKGEYNIHLYLREKDGDAIASINGTQFKIYHDGYDYNYDDKAFEIVTGDLKVVFQIYIDDYGTVSLAGVFYNEVGDCYYLPYKDSTMMHFYPAKEQFVQQASEIQKIFKYPREIYFQERADR